MTDPLDSSEVQRRAADDPKRRGDIGASSDDPFASRAKVIRGANSGAGAVVEPRGYASRGVNGVVAGVVGVFIVVAVLFAVI